MVCAGSRPFGQNFYSRVFVPIFLAVTVALASGFAIAAPGSGKGNQPPVIEEGQEFSLIETEARGSLIGQVIASSVKKNANLEYRIIGGNELGLFAIDLLTGDLTNAKFLDFETAEAHVLTVQVTDKFGRSATEDVIVNVVDVVVPGDISLLTSEIDGTNGYGLIGDGAGRPVAMLGDVNGDGIDDFAVSAPGRNQSAGSVYVVFGAEGISPAVFDLTSLDGTNGFRFDGEDSNDVTGELISGIGDINNDGFADLAISAPGAFDEARNAVGRVDVVFGGQQFPAVLSAADIAADLDGSTGFSIINDPLESWGFTPASIGDINGDGIDDFGIDAPNRSFDGPIPPGARGEIYAIFGRENQNNGASSFGQVLNLASLDASTGMILSGAPGDSIGILFGPTGDLNGDGFDDFTVTALGSTVRVYVVFGNLDPIAGNPPNPLDLSTLNGTDGFVIEGTTGGFLGVIGGGDVNGDGFSDAIIAAPAESNPLGETEVGALYVIFGGPDVDWSSFNMASIGDQPLGDPDGFKIVGAAASDAFGFPADNRSDINGDGFADIVAGSQIAIVPTIPPPPPEPTLYYLIAGSDQPFPGVIDLSDLGSTPEVMVSTIVADPRTEQVSAGSDVNGDGNDDFILSGGIDAGVVGIAHVVFGENF